MKKLLDSILLLSLFTVMAACTGVKIDEENFPDENFRSYLLQQPYGEDGRLTDEEIARITELTLCEENDTNGLNISSLKGIEHFTALEKLDCSYNQLTSLDVSQNAALTLLDCSINQLTSLDVSQNAALTALDCGNNRLTSLDVSQNAALTLLNCSINQLTSLDVSQNTALTALDCYYNQLTSLDVSQNTALDRLRCGFNQLAALDVSQNTALTWLCCNANQLTSLDVSQNTALTELDCYCNQIGGAGMDALVNSLPEAGTVGKVRICIPFFPGEGNVCTKSQVAEIKAKNWTPLYTNEEPLRAENWMEYEGI